MQNRMELFLGLSADLTGFGQTELAGTGMVDEYLGTFDAVLSWGVVDEVLSVYEGLPVGPDREAAFASRIIKDRKIGPLTQTLTLLWYCGAWAALPGDWRAEYGASPLDQNRVVSAEAYQAGLQWVVAGAHPAGAQQQGFGAWSQAP